MHKKDLFQMHTTKQLRQFKKDFKKGKYTSDEYFKLINPTTSMVKEISLPESTNGIQSCVENKHLIDSNCKDIHIERIMLSYQNNILFQDTNLSIIHGRKYGIIGPNGCGKTTLLRHICQRYFAIPSHINILYVEQEIESSDLTALEVVLKADVVRSNLLEKEQQLKDIINIDPDSSESIQASEELIDVYKQLHDIKAYNASIRASNILSGLQFTNEMQHISTKEFSGGWRMRISLARSLFLTPDLLLLDEPTNHLDLNAVIWLENYLRKYKKTILLVSHDRDFLNDIVSDIICIEDKKLQYYRGNYDNYENTLKNKLREHGKKHHNQIRTIQHLQQTQTASARKQKKKITKDGIISRPKKEYKVKFVFRKVNKSNLSIIQVKDVSFGYTSNKILFDKLELNIDQRTRVAIVGSNGSGKSTLMNLLLGEIKPNSGEVVRNEKFRTARFNQHFVDQLNMNETPLEYISRLHSDMESQDVKNYLGMFNLNGKMHEQSIHLLSGGQKSRIILAHLSLMQPDILFLDEPTNHLDIQAVDALIKALSDYNGGIIFITHDQRLISKIATELWICGDSKVSLYDGTFEQYKTEMINSMPDELFA